MPSDDVIQFFCSSCGKKYRVPGKMAGKKSKCKDCGAEMRVPVKPPAPAAPPAPTPAKAASAPPAPAKPTAPPEDDDAPIGLLDDDEPTGRATPRPPRGGKSEPKPESGKGKDVKNPSPSPKSRSKSKPKSAAPGRADAERKAGDRKRSGSADKKQTRSSKPKPAPAAAKPASPPEPASDPDWCTQLAPAGQPDADPVALPPSDAGAGFALAGGSRGGGGAKEGFVAGLVSIQHAFTAAIHAGKAGKAPLHRRISFGGAFIFLSSLIALILSATISSDLSPAGALNARFTDDTVSQFAALSPAAVSGMVTGSVGLVVAFLLIGWRFFVPRQEPESPMVLVIFAAIVLMTIVTAVAVAAGPAMVGFILTTIFWCGVILFAMIFGGWLLVRMNMEGDGNGIMLLLIPAITVPTFLVLSLLYSLNERANEYNVPMPWGEVAWGRLLLMWLIVAVVMLLMGGVVGLWTLLAVPLILLAASGEYAQGVSLGWSSLVGLLCVLCYLFLFVTRWRVMLKPVGWQFAVLIFGLAVVGQFMTVAGGQVVVAESEARIAANEGMSPQERYDRSEGRSRSRGDESVHDASTNGAGDDVADSYYDEELGLHILHLPGDQWYHVALEPMYLTVWDERGTAMRPLSSRARYLKTYQVPGPCRPAVEGFSGGGSDWQERPRMTRAFGTPNEHRAREGQSLNLWGCRFMVPPGCEVVEYFSNNARDARATIRVAGDTSARMTIHLQRLDPRHLGRSRQRFDEIRTSHPAVDHIDSAEYALLGGLSAMRVEEYPVGGGGVLFYAEKHEGVPLGITIEYTYSSKKNSESNATYLLETIARSLSVPEEQPGVVLDSPDVLAQADDTVRLRERPTMRWGVIEQWKPTYALMAPQFQRAGGSAQRDSAYYALTYDRGDTEQKRGDLESVQVHLFPVHELDSSTHGLWHEGISVPDQYTDPFVSAPGAEVTYHRLWAGQVFARYDRGAVDLYRNDDAPGNNRSLSRVTYAGYLSGFFVKIDITDQTGRFYTIEELEELVLSLRLPTAEQAAQLITDESRLRRMIERGQADLALYEGTYTSTHTQWPDGFTPPMAVAGPGPGGPAIPGTNAHATTYPPLDDEQLGAYNFWQPEADLAGLLEREAVELDGFSIRPIADLRQSGDPRTNLTWSVAGGMAGVGMAMRIDRLRGDAADQLTPLIEDTPEGQTFQIGSREIRSRGRANVTYREQAGIRVWRILMPSQGERTARTCYYIARRPGAEAVIRVRYNPTKPDQIDAFDAAVATLRTLEPIELEPED